jgi:hypothetical protein
VGETFDAMVEELVDYRLARYLFTKGSPLEEAIRLKVIQTRGRPILIFDRDRNPQLPEGETLFVADDVLYSGNFVKIALNVAHRAGQPENVLADLLWSWFGASAGQPGTAQYVELMPGKPHWHMRPASPAPTRNESANLLSWTATTICRNRAGWSTMASRRDGSRSLSPTPSA